MHGNLEVCQLGSGDGAVVEEQAGAKTTAESEAGRDLIFYVGKLGQTHPWKRGSLLTVMSAYWVTADIRNDVSISSFSIKPLALLSSYLCEKCSTQGLSMLRRSCFDFQTIIEILRAFSPLKRESAKSVIVTVLAQADLSVLSETNDALRGPRMAPLFAPVVRRKKPTDL
ncbi:hypothetical protein CB1_001795003 [Camelus ferus]|nr:hypothetical protein CB1_001795003 [Camelus ferus]